MSGYCSDSDLVVGNLLQSDDSMKTDIIRQVSDEMDGRLGWLYETPIDLDGLRDHEAKLLRGICRKLSLGRLIAVLAIPEEGSSLHALARQYITEGTNDLNVIANGDIVLTAPRSDNEGDPDSPDTGGVGAQGARTPSVSNADSESLVTAFHKQVYGGVPWCSPGPDDLVG